MTFSALLLFAQPSKIILLEAFQGSSLSNFKFLKSFYILLIQQSNGVKEELLTADQFKLIAVIIIVFAFLAIFGLVFVIRSYGELKKQYAMIESQHKEIAEKNEELAFKNESLEELNMSKNNTISLVAHDFKSPLDNIQGLVELIKLNKENLNNDQLNYLELLKKVSQETAGMVDVMLDVHRIEEELHELTLHTYDIIEIIGKAAALQEPVAQLKKVKIKLDLGTDSFTLKTDKQYFHQIISNILQNAIDFSPQNSTVSISFKERKNSVLIEISDEGPGISVSDRKRLFSGYQKLEDKGNEGKTTGIGLVIVMRLLEKLHGKVDVKSEQGQGSTFIVELYK